MVESGYAVDKAYVGKFILIHKNIPKSSIMLKSED